ncbi:hypothetical protein AGMMS49965_14330 [Bacteroidia bacterium]|nr:hypothetical protein AGMMS49965_14330 [Bacteroidia bacterium]
MQIIEKLFVTLPLTKKICIYEKDNLFIRSRGIVIGWLQRKSSGGTECDEFQYPLRQSEG